jgi:hypothetical protein
MKVAKMQDSAHASWRGIVLLFLLGLIVRLAFIHLYPAVYGGDSVMRMMHTDKILIAYQLPLLQLLLYLANCVSSNPLWVRYLMSLLGAFAGVAFYLLSCTLWGSWVGFASSLFFVFNPLLLVHSIVPYQEILMLLTLCLGLYYLLRSDPNQHLGRASLYLGLACLTRYEAWLITAVAALYYGFSRAREPSVIRVGSLLRIGAYFGWAPVLWLVFQRGLSPEGTFVLEGVSSSGRFYRIPYILGMTLYHAGPLLLFLAVAGLFDFWKWSLWKIRRNQMLLVGTLLLVSGLIFSAHGVPPDPARYITDREAHWPILWIFLMAGLGLSKIKEWLQPAAEPAGSREESVGLRLQKKTYLLVLLAALLWGLYETNHRIVSLISQPNLSVDYAVACYLEDHLAAEAKALVFAKPLPPSAIQDYLDKAYAKSGAKGLEAARKLVATVSIGPFDYSRVVVNSRLGEKRILSATSLQNLSAEETLWFLRHNRISLAVVFSDYSPLGPDESQLLEDVRTKGKILTIVTHSNIQARIYQISP